MSGSGGGVGDKAEVEVAGHAEAQAERLKALTDSIPNCDLCGEKMELAKRWDGITAKPMIVCRACRVPRDKRNLSHGAPKFNKKEGEW